MTFYKSTDHTIPAQSQAHLHSDRYIHTGLLNFYLILSYHNTFIESVFSLTLSHRPFLGFPHNIQSVSSHHLSSLSALHLRIDLMGPCIDLLYVQLYKVRMHMWEVFWCSNLLSMGVLLLVLLLLVPRQCSAQNYSGFHFEDNRVEARFGPENGYLVYETNIPIPNMVTRVFNVYFFGHQCCSYLFATKSSLILTGMEAKLVLGSCSDSMKHCPHSLSSVSLELVYN